jgi:hypothetical protein
MNAPTNDAKKLENRELPPTSVAIQSFGIIPAMLCPS